MWHLTPELTDEMTKKIQRREILSKFLTQLMDKWNSSSASNTIIHSKQQEQDR